MNQIRKAVALKEVSPLMREFSSYIAGALKRKLPAEVVEQTKLHLVDTLAAIISGSRLVPGKRVINYVKPFSKGVREAGVMGSRIVTSALHAGLANGMSAHADETDSVHPASRSHPATIIVPAELAVAEREGLSGELLLRAVVLGYDICTRILFALKQQHLKKTGHRGTAIGGLFGSAAAAGALLKLDPQRIRYVLSYCNQQASGCYTSIRETEHVEKAYQCGMAAHNGIAAALMVKSGFTGVEDAFSGELNFLSIFSPQADREALTRGLGREFEITRGGIKRWSGGEPTQAPLSVLFDLIQQHGIRANQVERLVAHMPDVELAIVNNRHMPNLAVQHLLAIMLIDGTVTFKSAHDEARMRNPKVLKLRSKIETVGDPRLTDVRRPWRSAIEVTLKDGRKLSHETMAAKGHHENPMTRQDVVEKSLDLMAPVIGKPRSQALMSKLLNISEVADVRSLRRLYVS